MSAPTPVSPEQWFKDHLWIYGVIGAVGVMIIALLLVICGCCCWFCRRKRRQRNRPGTESQSLVSGYQDYGATVAPAEAVSNTREPSVVEDMNRQRRTQEKSDRSNAQTAIEYYIRSNFRNMEIIPLLDMGSRMQKFWFKVTSSSGGDDLLVTIAPVSQRCAIKLNSANIHIINSMMVSLRDHVYIHPVVGVEYLTERGQLVINQPLIARGSLKDIIYRATPTSDWSQKYSRRSKGVTVDKVAIYGRHILEAMKFLYSLGFPPLGHVQSGNCFVKDNICRLSGYENTILGYKTRLYRLVKDHMSKVDILMFGHLVFEMTCGYELTTVAPKDIDLRNVNNKQIREVLMYIFTDGFPYDVNAILEHPFFGTVEHKYLIESHNKVTLAGDMQGLLKTVSKGKAVSKQPKVKKTKTPVIPPDQQNTGATLVEESEVGQVGGAKPTPTPRKNKQNSS